VPTSFGVPRARVHAFPRKKTCLCASLVVITIYVALGGFTLTYTSSKFNESLARALYNIYIYIYIQGCPDPLRVKKITVKKKIIADPDLVDCYINQCSYNIPRSQLQRLRSFTTYLMDVVDQTPGSRAENIISKKRNHVRSQIL
jgi:hypothetical protein